MKAKELRIGNLVYDYKKDNYLIGGIDLHLTDLHNVKITPIPLTEEWLLKFGFENIFENKSCDFIRFEKRISRTKTKFSQKIEIEHHYTKRKREIWTSIILRTMCMDNKGIEHCSFQIIPRNIKSVHQLQNLYFALTGEELEIKES